MNSHFPLPVEAQERNGRNSPLHEKRPHQTMWSYRSKFSVLSGQRLRALACIPTGTGCRGLRGRLPGFAAGRLFPLGAGVPTFLLAEVETAAADLRCPVDWLSNKCEPAIENAPMNRILVSHTRTATNSGTKCRSSWRLKTSLPRSWFNKVRLTAHQVIIAFIVAPSSQAPIKYQVDRCP